jgi:hypothetical protein
MVKQGDGYMNYGGAKDFSYRVYDSRFVPAKKILSGGRFGDGANVVGANVFGANVFGANVVDGNASCERSVALCDCNILMLVHTSTIESVYWSQDGSNFVEYKSAEILSILHVSRNQ